MFFIFFIYKDEEVNQFYINFGININGFGIINENLYMVRILERVDFIGIEEIFRNVKYVLKDDDLGDNYIINFKRDEVYGMFVFDVVVGEIMCFWEFNIVNWQEVFLVIDFII